MSPIRPSIRLAHAVLLSLLTRSAWGETAKRSAAESGGPKARVSLETTGYTDTDYVNVLSPTVAGGIGDELAGWSIDARYLVDVVTAASVDIVSTASPSWTEVRHVGSASGSLKLASTSIGAMAFMSREPDYLALTGGASLAIDMLDKNFTPYGAYSREEDWVGRTDLLEEHWRRKHVDGLQLGFTLVLGRATIGSLQVDASFERGYLSKPYRYVPLFAPGRGSTVPVGAPIAWVNQQRLSLRPAERLPTSRDRYALTGRLAHRFDSSTLRLDERLYADDWGLWAATTEARMIWGIGRRVEVWPHIRHHIQNGVSFWQRGYEAVPGAGGELGLPEFIAGDRELSPLQTLIVGAGLRIRLQGDGDGHWDLLLEGDVGETRFSDTLYVERRRLGYATVAVESEF